MPDSELSPASSDVTHPPRPPPPALDSSMPQLDTLISHLVASKRSLSSINHVWRANEIVTAARSAVEESVVVSARTGFLRRGLNNQLRLLYSVRTEVEEVSLRGRSDFSNMLKTLDTADAQLRKTLDSLRSMIVHESFRPAGEKPMSLHDFVDERGMDELHASLKGSIDRTNAAQAELESSNYEFDDELQSIKEALGNYRAAAKLASSRISGSSSSSSASNYIHPALSSLPGTLQSLEMHAQDMANLLESLVRHFDLCVTAVKHTEGGGAAAQSITGDMPAGVHVGDRDGSHNANIDAPLDPLSDSEYQEMVNVLLKDAAEAEDVVVEIQDHIGEMESILDNVLAQRESLMSVYQATTGVLKHLSALASTRLPRYIAQAHNFTRVWSEEQGHFKGGLADLSDLNSLYNTYLGAYDGLILEVARRGYVRSRIDKILRDTTHKLNQIYEEDVNARETFRVEQGDYLPSDIWPGVGRQPMRVEFKRIPGGTLQGLGAENAEEAPPLGAAEGAPPASANQGGDDEVIPALPKGVVEEALARVRARAQSDA